MREQTIESIIRQVLIDYSIGDLSDDIYVNLDGTLRSKSGDYFDENLERNIKKSYNIDNESIIYAAFGHEVDTQDGQEYFFISIIFEDGILFSAFNTDNKEERANYYMYWNDIKEVVFVKDVALSEEPNAYIISNDPTFEVLFETCDSQRLYLQDNTYMIIPCLYFGNYNVTDFLNELVSECEGFFYYEDSYQEEDYDNQLRGNDFCEPSSYQQETKSYNNVSQDRESIDITTLPKMEQFFIEYLKSNSNIFDENIASLYGISFERAQQLKNISVAI